ncbi:MAG: hypothetical protein C4525_07950 [Desulfarculus sp.]|nr:MAG: hypothetical protein C4525_07950 [Desulfarculus sp.]
MRRQPSLVQGQRVNNNYQNARTTFHSRILIVEKVLKERKSAGEAAEGLDVSKRTVYKWLACYRAGGREALYERSSRPAALPGVCRWSGWPSSRP